MPRLLSLDLARGCTVLFVPAIHSVMLYSDPSVYTTGLGYPLMFIAEGPGGQLFMLLMGIVFTFKEHHTLKDTLIKSAALLVAGYFLNMLKFLVPHELGLLPTGILRDLELTETHNAWLRLVLMGDILHFAAIALLILFTVHQSKKYYPFFAGSLAILLIFLSPALWDSHSPSPVVDYTLQLVSGRPPRVFFPLFPWLVYPLVGMLIGKYLQEDAERTFRQCGWMGLALMAAGGTMAVAFGEHSPVGFYRTFPGETLAHLGILLLALRFWSWISITVRPNRFLHLLSWSSRHITEIYIVQWILICWAVPVIGYQTQGVWPSLLLAILMTLLSYTFTYYYTNAQRKH